MKTVSVEYYGMHGSGRTLKEAKEDASRQLKKAMAGYYTPMYLSAGDEAAILYRTPHGWHYSFVRDGKMSEGCAVCGDDRNDAEQRLRRHLGANATDWRTCLTADDVHPIVRDQRDRRDIATGCKWQRRMRKALDLGLDDQNARYWIDGFTQFMTVPAPDRSILDAVA